MFKNHLPRLRSANSLEQKLSRFVSRCRGKKDLSSSQIQRLRRIDDRVLKLPLCRSSPEQPSRAWLDIFESWEKEENQHKIAEYVDPVTLLSYTASTGSKSCKEHMARSANLLSHMEPLGLSASVIPLVPRGDLRHNLAVMIDPPPVPENPPFPTDQRHNLLTQIKSHTYSGVHFPSSHLPRHLLQKMQHLKKSLLPDGFIWHAKIALMPQRWRQSYINTLIFLIRSATTSVAGTPRVICFE